MVEGFDDASLTLNRCGTKPGADAVNAMSVSSWNSSWTHGALVRLLHDGQLAVSAVDFGQGRECKWLP